MSALGCPFCTTLSGLDRINPDELVWRFPHSIALLGQWQYYHGYCMLVSRVHARELNDLDEVARRGYLDEMCMLAQAITQTCRPHKLNYELLGNQVPHLHWHLFPRSVDDPARLQPVWLALDLAERDPAQRQRLQTGPLPRGAVTAELRRTLTSLGAISA